jgi:hypothetical protein
MEYLVRGFASPFEVLNQAVHERSQKKFTDLLSSDEMKLNGPGKVGSCGHKHNFLRLYRLYRLTSLLATTCICEQIC